MDIFSVIDGQTNAYGINITIIVSGQERKKSEVMATMSQNQDQERQKMTKIKRQQTGNLGPMPPLYPLIGEH